MKKIKQITLCFLLVFTMALMTACTSKDKPMETTMAPTMSSTAGGIGTGPTDDMDSTESTGVIDGMVDDVLDMTSSSKESSTAH